MRCGLRGLCGIAGLEHSAGRGRRLLRKQASLAKNGGTRVGVAYASFDLQMGFVQVPTSGVAMHNVEGGPARCKRRPVQRCVEDVRGRS